MGRIPMAVLFFIEKNLRNFRREISEIFGDEPQKFSEKNLRNFLKKCHDTCCNDCELVVNWMFGWFHWSQESALSMLQVMALGTVGDI